MQELYRELQRLQLPPGKELFTSIIHAFGRKGFLNDMDRWFEEMKAQGVKPDEMTYTCLIQSHSKQGNLDSVLKLIEQVMQSFREELTFLKDAERRLATICNGISGSGKCIGTERRLRCNH